VSTEYSAAFDALVTEPPSATNWRRFVGALLHLPPGPTRERCVAEAELSLRSWPDALRSLTPALERRLVAPPYPSWLRLVRVFDMTRRANQLRELDSLERLVDEGQIRCLHTLRLRYCTFGDEGLALIGARIHGLVELQLGNCFIGDIGALTVAESPSFAGLERLSLYSNLVEDRGAQALVDSATLVSLRALNLYNNRLSAQLIERARERLTARGIELIVHGQGGWAFGRR
jgi:hypothetical protein